jgi:hypothetical protein
MIHEIKKHGFKSAMHFEALADRTLQQVAALYIVDRGAFFDVIEAAKNKKENTRAVDIDRKIIELQTAEFIKRGGNIERLQITQRNEVPANNSYRIGDAPK